MANRLALRVVYDPAKEKQLTPTVDLVLVHGLDGDATGSWTWRDEGSKVFWPGELLPEERPRTRVLSFSYNAKSFHNNTDATIRDNARSLLALLNVRRIEVIDPASRPLIFVGHCLGGLVIKQAMCFANSESEYRSIALATKGIIFFGTPHGGADKASWKLVASGYSLLGGGPASALVDAITRASDDLEEIKEDFVQLSPLYPITSFYEEGYWGNTGKCIVSPTSARMMIENECAVGVDADHRAICQFEGAESYAFEVLCERIGKAVGPDIEETTKDSGRRTAKGMVGSAAENEPAAAARLESWTVLPCSADPGRDMEMSESDMGGYAQRRRVMMIDYEPVRGEDGVHDIFRDEFNTTNAADPNYSPLYRDDFVGGRRRWFFKRVNKLWS
ncbi:hypothetical protein CHGG_03425 [Chaetomium globosum CBS 148.51]|uniref:DUF676 domain-containing protein n=1 Tax=Chaetomium globosum (strain ATCC 6205 / CBS 148.51 / DSM 1962 / NBRC 6347 / NRRL 1970) TaxID=306901 RepID=Q2H8M9_CHAGB|nr:uncharacterized protein CHGG_03425 [Chaetomium globosum CBS 148.51]EAQ91490.1 hypothetical protein CHGG_03425 [Chaetomium globosum CBS 148.51]